MCDAAQAQGWYNLNWSYRRAVTVANPVGTTLTNHQVQITLDGSFDFSRAKSDGADVRVASGDGTTLLPIWIESWNPAGTQASLWVKVPSLPPSGATLYLYYGNSAALSASDGASTYTFFDDFSTVDVLAPKNWIRRLEYTGGVWGPSYVAHDWKYSMEMHQGALYFAIARAQNGWPIEGLDAEIEQEFNHLHSQINPDGTTIGTHIEPQYEYGVTLSGLALGYMHFKLSNPVLAARCYDDMVKVYGYVKSQWQNTIGLNDAGASSMALHGFSNTWKAFTDHGDTVTANEAKAIVQNYGATFMTNQSGSGSWNGADGVQEHQKRDFGMLVAYDVTGNASYLTAVRNNINYILATFWVSSNGGLTWHGSPTEPFFECHQMWFMIAVRMLYTRSGGTYNYLTQGEAAWRFLTDNNYANIDLYVHNYVNRGAFFSYRQVLPGGTYQSDTWKGSYEIGTALWGMALNYEWLSSYQSSHSSQAFNYLDMMVKQIKKSPANKGFLYPGIRQPRSALWSKLGTPTITIAEEGTNNVVSILGVASHDALLASVDKSFGNFIFETRVKLLLDVNNSCTPEVGFRYANTTNRYITMLRGEALNDMFLRKYQGGSASINGSYPYNYAANQYYALKVAVNADTIALYMNGTRVTTYRDAGTSVLTGGICLQNYGNVAAVYYDDVRLRSYAAADPTSSVGGEEQAGGFPETRTCAGAGTVYTFPLTQVAMEFSVMPQGGGEVTVRRYAGTPPAPTFPPPPTGATFLPTWLDITSTMANQSFRGTVTVNLTGVAGFGPGSRMVYYNATSGRWVIIAGTYDGGAHTLTCTTTHFTAFGVINTTEPVHDVFVSTAAAAPSPGVVYPNETWSGGYPGRSEDWGFTGGQPVTFAIVPQAGMQIGACELMAEWDSTVLSLDSVSFTGSVFSGPDLQSAGSTSLAGNLVSLSASLISPTNITTAPGDYIARLYMRLKKPGHSAVSLIGDEIVTFNPPLAPGAVLIVPQQAEVKAYVGDVASAGGGTSGDGKLDFEDLVPWTVAYWSGVPPHGMDGYKAKYDFGPTADGSVLAMPAYDGKVDFEDLMVFSIGYGLSFENTLPKVRPQTAPVRLSLGKPVGTEGETLIPVVIDAGGNDVRGLRFAVRGTFGPFLGADKGQLLAAYRTPVMVFSREEGGVVHVDCAVAGLEAPGLGGKGEVIVLRFAGNAGIQVTEAECRNSGNRRLDVVFGSGEGGLTPSSYGLEQNYPNPFNPTTVIGFQVPEAGRVILEVYTLLGERIATLVDDVREPGVYRQTWDGRDQLGRRAASGIYIYRLRAGEFVGVRSMLLLK
jgi:hypothetical protein